MQKHVASQPSSALYGELSAMHDFERAFLASDYGESNAMHDSDRSQLTCIMIICYICRHMRKVLQLVHPDKYEICSLWLCAQHLGLCINDNIVRQPAVVAAKLQKGNGH